jgi:hypothetical protein
MSAKRGYDNALWAVSLRFLLASLWALLHLLGVYVITPCEEGNDKEIDWTEAVRFDRMS